jgi:hypothetical protein
MNSKRCLWIHFVWHHRLHLNAFELRELSQRWIFKRSFFRSWNNFFHLHINMILHLQINMTLHLQISMKILHVLRQSSSIFRSRRTISRSYHFWFSHAKKRINDFDLMNSFEFVNSTHSIISQHSESSKNNRAINNHYNCLQCECTFSINKLSSSYNRFWMMWEQDNSMMMIKILMQAEMIVKCSINFLYWDKIFQKAIEMTYETSWSKIDFCNSIE